MSDGRFRREQSNTVHLSTFTDRPTRPAPVLFVSDNIVYTCIITVQYAVDEEYDPMRNGNSFRSLVFSNINDKNENPTSETGFD